MNHSVKQFMRSFWTYNSTTSFLVASYEHLKILRRQWTMNWWKTLSTCRLKWLVDWFEHYRFEPTNQDMLKVFKTTNERIWYRLKRENMVSGYCRTNSNHTKLLSRLLSSKFFVNLVIVLGLSPKLFLISLF